jgi:Fe-S-cluster-containing hydrogenase component 2
MHLLSDASLCTDCRICQLTCGFAKTMSFNPSFGLLRIEVKKEGLVAEPITCRQCVNPLCLRVCLPGAVHRDEDNIVRIDPEKCTGCGACAKVCAYDVIVIRDRTAYKCDLCGGAPKCVTACPTRALQIVMEANRP